jgi:hypothetical protein
MKLLGALLGYPDNMRASLPSSNHQRGLRSVVNVYVDGYNFFRPLAKAGCLELAWCDLRLLGARLVRKAFGESTKLGAVKYFTATIPERFNPDPEGVRRKHWWLNALNTHSGGEVEIVHGTFNEIHHSAEVRRKGERAKLREKQTDVKLAIAVVRDAALAKFGECPVPYKQSPPEHLRNQTDHPSPFDRAIIFSGDSDMLPAAEMAWREFGREVSIFYLDLPGFSKAYPVPAGCPVRLRPVSKDDLEQAALPKEIVVPGSEETITWKAYQDSLNTSRLKEFSRRWSSR